MSVTVPTLKSPPPCAGRVVGDGAVGERQRAGVEDPPPTLHGRVAGDGAVGERQRAGCTSPPPLPLRLEPPVMVRPEIVAVTSVALERSDGEARRPLTVTPADGPVIVVVPAVLLSSSVAPSVMVCRRVKTVGSKLISESAYCRPG